MITRFSAGILLVLSLACAFGAQLRGVSFPTTIESPAGILALNGIGLRQKTIFNVDVYVAALYTKSRSSDAVAIIHSSAPKQIDVVFLRDVSAGDIAQSWIEGFANNCLDGCPAMSPKLEQLNHLMTDVKKGQKVSLCFFDGKTMLTTAGQQPKTIEGKEFSETVLATFIGVPPSSPLKRGLLGLPD